MVLFSPWKGAALTVVARTKPKKLEESILAETKSVQRKDFSRRERWFAV